MTKSEEITISSAIAKIRSDLCSDLRSEFGSS
jgi:hypothetical protein